MNGPDALALVAALALVMPQAAAAHQEPGPTGPPKLRIAVLDVTGKAQEFQTDYRPTSTSTTVEFPPPADFARGLTEMVTTALVETDRFVVLERAALEAVLQEQDFGASGRVNPETAAPIGSMIGAQILITGDISEFNYQTSSLGGGLSVLGGLEMGAERLTAMVALDLRLLDAVTGQVISSVRGQGEASATGADATVEVGDQSFSTAAGLSTPLGRASRDAVRDVVRQLVAELADEPWQGRIVDVRDGTIYVNAGSSQGIRTGMAFEVFREQEALLDPATGRALGAPEERLGSIRILSVQEEFAVAEAVEGSGFSRNDLIRFQAPPEAR